ncbi:PREDICTED: uncharacterized protein LOC109168873 [Ipomoea nil]|uniref:uncharacterized protein LOC109168873 n=1 Tax=Ipomoea nil TaxID=35883 RepID=UPI0009019C9D|nr:PREDICTED: uncharacterized protein LOC109168873 [Ipomoea nil]
MSPSGGYFSPLFLLLLISGTMMPHNCMAALSPDRDDVLAAHVPLTRLQLHTGRAYNITDKNYWAASVFSGIHGYVIAGIWLLIGLGFGCYIIVKNSRPSSASIVQYPDSSYILFFSFIVFFSILAMVASSFVLVADKGSLHRTKKLTETILDAGSDAQRTMQSTKGILLSIQTLIDPYDSNTSHMLNVTTHMLRRDSLSIQSFIDKTRHSGNEAIVALYVANLTVVIANLVLLVAALVSFIFRWPLGLIIIIFCCWILTTLNWVLTGINFIFHNFAEDICIALDDFEQNPESSSLQSVLPCANSTNSKKLLVKIGYTIHTCMFKINVKLTALPALQSVRNEEDNFGVWKVCDPFSGSPNYTFNPNQCPEDAIPIGNLPTILSRVTCYSSSRNCRDEGRFIPEAIFYKCSAFSESMQELIDIFPDLVRLIQCSKVKQAFSDIVQRQCKPFRKTALELWASMLSLSISMVFLTLLWAAKAYQDKGKNFSRCSIVPDRV